VYVYTQVTFTESVINHPLFAVSSVILLLLFLLGIHKRVVMPSMYPSVAAAAELFPLVMSFVFL